MLLAFISIFLPACNNTVVEQSKPDTEVDEDNNNDNKDENVDDGTEDRVDGCRFCRVDEVTSGKAYLIAAEGYIATPVLNENYDYLQVTEGDSDNDGVIVLDNCNNAFIIEAVSGGYTIKQAKDEVTYTSIRTTTTSM